MVAAGRDLCRACGGQPELLFEVRLDRMVGGIWNSVETVVARPVCEPCRNVAFRDGILQRMHEAAAGYVLDHCDSCRATLYGEAWIIEYAPLGGYYRRKARGAALTIQNRVCSGCILRIGAEFDARVPGRGHMIIALRGAMTRHDLQIDIDDVSPPSAEQPRPAVAPDTLQRLISAAFEQSPMPSGFFTLSGRLLFANSALRALGPGGVTRMRAELEPRIEELCEPNPPAPRSIDGVIVVPVRNAMGDIAAVLGVIGLDGPGDRL